jgi:hypothetical protein
MFGRKKGIVFLNPVSFIASAFDFSIIIDKDNQVWIFKEEFMVVDLAFSKHILDATHAELHASCNINGGVLWFSRGKNISTITESFPRLNYLYFIQDVDFIFK